MLDERTLQHGSVQDLDAVIALLIVSVIACRLGEGGQDRKSCRSVQAVCLCILKEVDQARVCP